jgi:hypothetical protein
MDSRLGKTLSVSRTLSQDCSNERKVHTQRLCALGDGRKRWRCRDDDDADEQAERPSKQPKRESDGRSTGFHSLELLERALDPGSVDTRMNDLSPSHTSAPSLNPPIDPHAGMPSHPHAVDPDLIYGGSEFNFDRLWNNWINHVVPVSAMGPGITPMAPQFSPIAPNAPPGPFGTFTLPPESRISPAAVISGTIPLYHSTNFG